MGTSHNMLNFLTAITLHEYRILSHAISQMKDLFKIYLSMYDTTVFVNQNSGKSKLENYPSTFYCQNIWQMEPLDSGSDINMIQLLDQSIDCLQCELLKLLFTV